MDWCSIVLLLLIGICFGAALDAESGVIRWQETNPVTTEALIQQTLGGPQPIYNGGLLHPRLRYYDSAEKCPGLPPDVGALVENWKRGARLSTW